jgi:hypothetical protein
MARSAAKTASIFCTAAIAIAIGESAAVLLLRAFEATSATSKNFSQISSLFFAITHTPPASREYPSSFSSLRGGNNIPT